MGALRRVMVTAARRPAVVGKLATVIGVPRHSHVGGTASDDERAVRPLGDE